MKLLFFVLIFVIGYVVGSDLDLPPKIFYDLNGSEDLFQKYVIEYDKHYNEEEYWAHYEIFKDNLEKINELNKNSNSTVYDINQFTDLKFEEVANTYMGMSLKIDVTNVKTYEPKGFAPASLDYRRKGWVTPIKDQGHCNTCYIFSAVGAIEGWLARRTGRLISLSEQEALDCDIYEDGCKTGGIPVNAMNVISQQGGCMTEVDYPYEQKKGQCRTKSSKIVAKISGGLQIDVKNENDLKDALANYGPLSIGLIVGEGFCHYKGDIFRGSCEGNGKHAVLLVGYDSVRGEEFWIIKNSWSERWGERGYMRMKMGAKLCGIGNYVAAAV
ncbi:uncharacterized protein LOC116779861 [Danaus plexippus]|uniref:uncharacterized protein LOC116779861 n=1 Tax=Danaus plexippus TaxID=13037 RepID=UPI002AB25E25|nr:uncharacterized protein LOC116779861 [Danaus plexippus]